jgi:hypothetical protein
MNPLKFIAHSKKAIALAKKYGWHPGARYSNLRDIKTFAFRSIGFLDIDWKNYCFEAHLAAAALKRPRITIARDIECIHQLDSILLEAEKLSKHSKLVALVPKDKLLHGRIDELIPKHYILAYSVPTKYGGTSLSLDNFDRPVHLLGGRPDVQRKLARSLKVFSFDCNRFTFDARFGDYFDGEIFRPHPSGGYENCLRDSLININRLWEDYVPHIDVRELMGALK